MTLLVENYLKSRVCSLPLELAKYNHGSVGREESGVEVAGRERRGRESEGSDGQFSLEQKAEGLADCGYHVFRMNIQKTRNLCDA